MSMTKIIPVGSWDSFDVAPVEMMKVAGNGRLGPGDRKGFLEKRAADHVFVDMLEQVKLGSGDIPIHAIAIGSTEGYGPNRNGDGFDEKTCKAQHHTFVKFARFYRNHKNKNTEKSYGTIKLSAYNPRMRRIELFMVGNGTKEAARRNNGLVLPGTTIDRLQRGDDSPFSMACKVALDICQTCFNKAASRAEYCTPDTCISPTDGFRGLGCRDGLAKIASNGRQQYVENPNALFFDFSEVFRPADRIAYGGKADYFGKAAAAHDTMGGAELAEWWALENGPSFSFDWSGTDSKVAQQILLAEKLAGIERELENSSDSRDLAMACGFLPQVRPPLNVAVLGTRTRSKLSSALTALAHEKIALSFRDFLRLVLDVDGEKLAAHVASVTPHLPGVFSRLAADPNLADQVRSNTLIPDGLLPSAALRNWAKQAAPGHSVDPMLVQDRAQRMAIRQVPAPIRLANAERVKIAAAGEPGETLARQYALYKLATVAAIQQESRDLPLTLRWVTLQNYIEA